MNKTRLQEIKDMLDTWQHVDHIDTGAVDELITALEAERKQRELGDQELEKSYTNIAELMDELKTEQAGKADMAMQIITGRARLEAAQAELADAVEMLAEEGFCVTDEKGLEYVTLRAQLTEAQQANVIFERLMIKLEATERNLRKKNTRNV